LIVKIAHRAVLVTAKYDRDTQISIQALITQLSILPKKAINSQNKLLVIHNYRDVNHHKDLLQRIEDVKKTYVSEDNDAPIEEDSDDENTSLKSKRGKEKREAEEEKERPWLLITVEGYTYYATPKTIHIFLLNDEAPGESSFNPREYNNKAITAILSVIRTTLPEKINLINSVLKESQWLLNKYIRDWKSSNCRVRLDKIEHRILPAKMPKKENEDKGFQERDFKWEEEDTFDYENDDFWDKPFRLPKIRFTDTGVISGIWHELHGEMYYSRTKITFWVEVPHLSNTDRTDEFISIETDKDRKTLSIFVNLEKHTPPKGFKQGTQGFRQGTGSITFDLEPLGIRYVLSKRVKELYNDEYMVIENGILRLTLDKLPDENDEEDYEEN